MVSKNLHINERVMYVLSGKNQNFFEKVGSPPPPLHSRLPRALIPCKHKTRFKKQMPLRRRQIMSLSSLKPTQKRKWNYSVSALHLFLPIFVLFATNKCNAVFTAPSVHFLTTNEELCVNSALCNVCHPERKVVKSKDLHRK